MKPILADAVESEYELNVGPQHPSTHGVLRVVVKLEGETILSATPVLGYLHRCFEKITEGLQYYQVVPVTDRLDYAAAITNEWAYVIAVERLAGITVPERAEYLRVAIGELQRIQSHLLGLGAFAHDFEATTAFIYCLIAREHAMDLFELLTGARLTHNYLRIGGVLRDIPDDFPAKMRRFTDDMRHLCDEYRHLVLENGIFVDRTDNVGLLEAEEAMRLGASGPVLRSTGVKWDLRKNLPYSVYERFSFTVPVGEHGDCFDRARVRLEEMLQSCDLIDQALAALPGGEVRTAVPNALRPPAGELYSAIEGPRGEVGVFLVSDGSPKPYRVKWQAPSFNNLQIVSRLAPGHRLADLMAILGSIDIILGEVER